MKKRLSLIFILLIVSSALIFTSFAVNNKKNTAAKNKSKITEKVQPVKIAEEAEPQVKASEEKPKAVVKTTESKETKTAASKTAAEAKHAVNVPKPAANVKFIDTISNKTLYEVYVNFDGKNAFDVTLEALNKLGQDPRPTEVNRMSGYIAGMLNLTEKKSGGPKSGWLYYVNGVKAAVGSKEYSLKNGDKLVWKFVEDYTKY